MPSIEVAAVAGVALSAVGAVTSGIAQGQAASYQAAVNRNNAIAAQQNATYARQAGVVQEEEAGRRAAAQEGAVKAAIAANNIDVNSGSALNVEKSQRETGLLSEETVANNASLQAYGYDIQASGYTAQAGLLQGEAAEALPASLLSGAGSLATNASEIPPKFASMAANGEPANSSSTAAAASSAYADTYAQYG